MSQLLTQVELDIAGNAADKGLPGASPFAALNSDLSNQELLTTTAFGSFISRIIDLIVVVAVLLLLGYLVWGAIEWITAGESSKVSKARERITTALIGFLVLFGVVGVLLLVQQFVGITILNFGRLSEDGEPTRFERNLERNIPEGDTQIFPI